MFVVVYDVLVLCCSVWLSISGCKDGWIDILVFQSWIENGQMRHSLLWSGGNWRKLQRKGEYPDTSSLEYKMYKNAGGNCAVNFVFIILLIISCWYYASLAVFLNKYSFTPYLPVNVATLHWQVILFIAVTAIRKLPLRYSLPLYLPVNMMTRRVILFIAVTAIRKLPHKYSLPPYLPVNMMTRGVILFIAVTAIRKLPTNILYRRTCR